MGVATKVDAVDGHTLLLYTFPRAPEINTQYLPDPILYNRNRISRATYTREILYYPRTKGRTDGHASYIGFHLPLDVPLFPPPLNHRKNIFVR